jgi:hypothetical protein
LGLVGIVVLGVVVMIAEPMQRAFSLTDAVAGLSSEGRSRTGAAAADSSLATAETSKPHADAAGPVMLDARIVWPALAVAAATPLAAWWFVRRRSRSVLAANEPVLAIQPKLRAKFVEKRQAILSVLSSDIEHLSQGQVPVAAIFSTAIFKLPAETPVEELRLAMKERWIRHVLICSKS